MRPEPRKRLDTGATQSPLTHLEGQFAALSLLIVEKTPGSSGADQPPPVPPAPPLWKMGRVVLRRERAHRGGKTVIVIDGFATHLPASVIEAVASKVRTACGCGGATKGRSVEVQGDQPQKVRAVLETEGFEVAGVR